MTPHTFTDEFGDSAYRVVAVNFSTRRMVVECGDGLTSWRTGFELRQLTLLDGRTVDDWRRFDPGQCWHDSPGRACQDGGLPLGRCLDYARFLIRPNGPGLAPLRAWLLAQAEAIKADQARKAAESREILAGDSGVYTPEQQARMAGLGYDYQLPVSITVLASSGLLPTADWLLQLRRHGMRHGSDLRELGERWRHSPMGPADIDSRINTMLALGLCAPYDYEPRPGTRTFETEGQLSKAQQLAWRQHGKLPTHSGKLYGCQFWTFRAGRALASLPVWSL